MKLAVIVSILLLVVLMPVRAQEITPLPPNSSGVYANIPQALTNLGFPQLGSPSAPVLVTEYCGFDTGACGTFRSSAFATLLDRITAGDVLYTFVPLVGYGDIPNGRSATRAALCAAEQGMFWQFSDMLYGWQIEFGSAAYDSDRVLSGIDSLGVNRALWDECMITDRPDVVLTAAQATADAEIGFGGVPYALVNGVPTLADVVSINAAIQLELDKLNETETPAAPDAEATEDTLVVTVEPLLGEQIEPPLDITLPAGWRYGYDTLVLDDVDVLMRTIPLAVYTGPVTGGTGTIVLLWGFPNLVAANPLQPESSQPDLWADGLRLLRLAVIEQGCNVGTDMRLDYTIGGLSASGTQFAAVDCPELPDTRGWFAGLRDRGINFVFYAFAEPITAMDGSAADELQAILDTVSFRVPESVTATPAS